MKKRPLTADQTESARRRRARYSRIGKMRHQRHRLLIHAMKGDGTFESHVMVQICKAFFVLPEELGLRTETVEHQWSRPSL